jgi:hypothetical protein
MPFLEFVLCDGAFAYPAGRIHWKMTPLILHGLNLRQIVGMNHFHLNQTTLEMDVRIYSRHRGLKGTDPCRFSVHIRLKTSEVSPVVGNYVLKLGPDWP